MNDADIIKALECCCTTKGSCKECPLNNYEDTDECQLKVMTEAYKLIKRQQAEIEELKLENRALSQNRITMSERLEIVNNARDKAIREFAEKLREKSCNHLVEYDEGGWSEKVSAVKVDEIDNLVKEMTGGEENAD